MNDPIPQDIMDQLTVRVNHDLEPRDTGMWIASVSVFKVIRSLLAELAAIKRKELLPVQQMEAYAFCGDPEDKPMTETSKVMKGAAILIDPLIEKITKERDDARAQLAAQDAEIERLTEMGITMSGQIGRYQAQLAQAQQLNRDWLKANAPGGWIDVLRNGYRALEGELSEAQEQIRRLSSPDSEYVLVPRVPTKEMLEEGWYEAHDEDAAGVWRVMIKVASRQHKEEQ